MNFLVNAYDYKDEKALARRLEVRGLHMEGIKDLYEKKNILFASAMLNEDDIMCGSSLVVEFDSRDDLNKWLESEPYVKNKVWEKIDIRVCKVADMFL
ncbi:MAG: YciI family protein [Acidaminobacteraceae bacterium]